MSAAAPGTGTFHSRKSSVDDYVKDIETLSKDQLLEDGLDYEKGKKQALESVAISLYPKTYSYLDFIYHTLTDCIQSKQVMIRCPLPKCRQRKKMRFNDLRLHLINECTKITLECSLCKGRFRRPRKDLHDCRRVYIQRLQHVE